MNASSPSSPPSPSSEPVGGPAVAVGRIVLLTTSHRVAPGLLSWPAWQALRAADRVLCADGAHPQLPYLRDAGITVEEASPTAEDIVAACAGGRTVVVVATGEGEPALTDGLARLAGSGRVSMPELELLPASYDLPGARLLDLVQVMDRIRAECPWSSQQTHKGLAKYAVEESYELVEAIETGDYDELREELGDVLLQVAFHARIAEEDEESPFSVDDVAGTIVAKLIHRHPHVFGDATATTPEEVKEHWLRTKAAEKRRESVTDGVPLHQPGLALAAKLASRARMAGLDVPLPTAEGSGTDADATDADATGVETDGMSTKGRGLEGRDAEGRGLEGRDAEGREFEGKGFEGSGAGGGGAEHIGAEGIGYELLALAARAEAEGVDPEAALRAAARAYRDAIRATEGVMG